MGLGAKDGEKNGAVDPVCGAEGHAGEVLSSRDLTAPGRAGIGKSAPFPSSV